MKSSDLYQAGQLSEAIEAQIGEVKRSPGDEAKRLFLFELLAFAGELDRAEKHIKVLKFDDIALEATRRSYEDCLAAERKRRKLFAYGTQPQFLTAAPEHVRLRLEAVAAYRKGNDSEAAERLHEALELTPARPAKLNDQEYESIRDGDDLFAGVLEVFAKGEYYWVALEQIERLSMTPPKTPRDLLWRPARLELADAVGEVFLPTLYPKSHMSENDAIKLGRETDWEEKPGEIMLGNGLKEFFLGEEPSVIHDWLTLEIAQPEPEPVDGEEGEAAEAAE